jgi:hypothetical protein
MKNLFLFLVLSSLFLCISFCAHSQTNTFPSSGNVGIGTINPTSLFHVLGSRSNSINSANAIAKIGGADVFTCFGALNGTPNYGTWIQPLRPSDDYSFPLLINPLGGNVGIGVTDPDAKLEINGSLKVETDIAELRLASTHSGGQTFVLRSHIGGVTYTGFEVFDETNSVNRFTISQDGKIGFGITTPEAKLHIRESTPLGSASGNYQTISIQNATTNNNFYKKEFVFRESNGNDWTTTSWYDGIDIDGAFPVPMSSMKCWYKRTPYGDTALRHSWGNGSTTYMGIGNNGNVLIGKTNQINTNYKLDVAGKIRADEVVVNTTGADFVFKADYKLPSLVEVESYIKINNHLPGITSALVMKVNGMNVSEMQTKLLQKIEELTLYVIELNKKLEQLESEQNIKSE